MDSSIYFQHLFRTLSNKWQRERSETQLTLGELISSLEAMPADALVADLRNPHSYRGYYSDLAFEFDPDNTRTPHELLVECRAAMGATFEGYKGGDFLMGKTTPLWVASYGNCGERLISLQPDGSIETAPENDLREEANQ